MSINNLIARGFNPGAGAVEGARNAYAMKRDQMGDAERMENRNYLRSRDQQNMAFRERELSGQRLAQARQHALSVRQAVASAQSPEQARAMWEAGQNEAIDAGFLKPEEAQPDAWQQIYVPVDPDAGFKDFERRERLKADLKANAPLSPLDAARLRGAETGAAANELKLKEAQAKADSAKSTKSEVSALASDILNDGGYESVYGAAQGLFPTIRPDIIDAEANVDRLIDLLTLENTSKMTGVLSESDIKILQRAGTKLANKRISNKAAKQELERIAGIFAKAEASGMLVRDSDGNVVGSQPITIGGATVTFDE